MRFRIPCARTVGLRDLGTLFPVMKRLGWLRTVQPVTYCDKESFSCYRTCVICAACQPVEDCLCQKVVRSCFAYCVRLQTSFSITNTQRTRAMSTSSSFSKQGIKLPCSASAWPLNSVGTQDLCGRLRIYHNLRFANQSKVTRDQSFSSRFLCEVILFQQLVCRAEI